MTIDKLKNCSIHAKTVLGTARQLLGSTNRQEEEEEGVSPPTAARTMAS